MAWRQRENLHTPHTLPPPIPGTEALRQAALAASWKRDRAVARRRLMWRWGVFYAQRYAPHSLAALTVLAGALYVSGHWPSWPSHAADAPAADAVRAPYVAPSVPTTAVASSAEAVVPPPQDAITAEEDMLPLALRSSVLLAPRSATPSAAPEVSTDTLSLKPENWLHSKEP